MSASLSEFGIRDSYGRKFAALLVVTVLLVGSVGAVIYVTVDDEINAETEERLASTATAHAVQLDNWVQLTNAQVESLTRADAVRNIEQGDTVLHLKDQLERVSERQAVSGTYFVNGTTEEVVVASGQEAVVTEERQLTPAAADRLSELEFGASRRVAYSEPFVPEGGEHPRMLVASQQPTEDRFVVAVVDLATLSGQIFGRSSQNGTGEATVVTRDGTVVLADDRGDLLTQESVDAAAFGNESGFYTQSETNGSLAVGYAAVPTQPWVTTQRVPTSEAYALQNTVSKQILLLLGVLVAALGAIGLTVGRNTVRSVTDLATRAEALQEGDLETRITSSRSDEFGTVYAALDEMRRSLRSEIEEARAARERADEARRESERQRERSEAFSTQLETTAQEYAETMQACADGDLTRRLVTDSESDAMTTVARSFNDVLDNWERTIDDIRAVSQQVSDESDETATDVTAARETSETLAASMESIADDATEQAQNLQGVNEEMEALSASIEEVSATTNEVTRRADRALAEGETGREAASAAAEELDAIESHTEQAVEQVQSLDSLMSDIEDIVTTIETIADQTDMLAVNASIEAANASGESDGFAVVAEEVKSLAEQTQAATAEIAATVEQVRGQTTATVEEIQQTRTRVREGTETIEEALAALDTVVDEVEGTTAGVREINSGIQDQAESTQEVVTMVGDVTAVSETTATEAETRATEASEQSETVADIAASVDRFADRARQLQERLDAFETSERGDVQLTARDADAGELPAGDEQSVRPTETETDDISGAIVPSEDSDIRVVGDGGQDQ